MAKYILMSLEKFNELLSKKKNLELQQHWLGELKNEVDSHISGTFTGKLII